MILSLGLTVDTAVTPVRSSPVFAACCDGTLGMSAASLHTPFALPLVVVQRLFPIAEQLRLSIAAISSGTGLAEPAMLYKHKVIQFMRCYASLAKFCPKFYLSTLFEWLIAQCVEMYALLSIVVTVPRVEGLMLSYPKLMNTCGWVQGNVAFVLCFIRGSHFTTLLSNDYEQGLRMVVDPTGQVDMDTSPEAAADVMDGLKGQMQRLEQQEEAYSKLARASASEDPHEPGARFAHDAAPGKVYKMTEDMVRESSWNTVHALCISQKRVPELDTVVAPLYRVFASVGREMDLVHWAIDKDISEGVKEANLLFRTPSTATRLLRTVFFNAEGTEYLKSLVYPSLKKFGKQKFPVELDPFRLQFDLEAAQRDEMLKGNAKFLQSMASEIMTTALKTVEQVPIQIRKFLLYARNTFMGAQNGKGVTNEDNATKLVVCSLFFLRFVCPAIVTPHSFGIFDHAPSPDVQRGLILLGKVLQSTASGVEFDGTKEEYMTCCNPFVKNTQSSMLKLYGLLIDAQAIGVRELKNREKSARVKKQASKRELMHLLQDEFEGKVSMLRDCALLVNEFGLKQSFLPMFRSGGADDESVRTVRSLIKLDVKLHEQRASARAEFILSAVLKQNSPYSMILQNTVADFAEYLPNDLVVFSAEDFALNSSYSDTAQVGALTHPLLLLDTITAHRPSRLAAIARMLRSSCQEVWEAGIALRDLCAGAASTRDFHAIADQDAPVVVVPTLNTPAAEEGSIDVDVYSQDEDSDTQSMAHGGAADAAGLTPTSAGTDSSGKKAGSKLLTKLRVRSGSASGFSSGNDSASGSPVNDGEGVKNSLSGLITPARKASAPSTSSFLAVSPFSSPATLRKRKAFKKRGVAGIAVDDGNLWAPALVLPQVLGLLHFLTVLRHTLKHARLENRILMETPDVDSVLANCVFEYSKLAKQAGLLLLAMTVQDPSNPEVGALGLAIANAGVLITRSSLILMNSDRQILRRSERKSKLDKKHHSGGGDESSGGSSAPVLRVPPSESGPGEHKPTRSGSTHSTPKVKRKQRLQKTSKTTFSPSKTNLSDLIEPSQNPLMSSPQRLSPRFGAIDSTVSDGEDSAEADL